MTNKLKHAKKILKFSISSIVLISIIAIIYSLIRSQGPWDYVLQFNIIISSFIIVFGVISFFAPINLKKSNRLVDHSNITEVLREEKEKKVEGSLESILWGISNIIIVGVGEIIVKSYLQQ
ncbi:hypothetical protein F8154_02535 [Alkaliphilus pronyensis]|uniref:Uncharacterized protein n=1 Tax=Alkaliphilus pronyensis TaxID=1482732 RepID=A0A6I0FEL9_9FIRM|nr:hypothetical protein [Alkaliphilus pronyensis]KAB3537706.1 hypothetical protein F8154_02535 [Alkaliphilus pronyensis]